ncbi:unnamed protein product, partial [Rotaria sordida]
MDELSIITEFQLHYTPQLSIWWYTRECFIYHMLNRALGNLEADIIVNIGFYLVDLHKQIEALHNQQANSYGDQPFLLYRGQGLSNSKSALYQVDLILTSDDDHELRTLTDRMRQDIEAGAQWGRL